MLRRSLPVLRASCSPLASGFRHIIPKLVRCHWQCLTVLGVRMSGGCQSTLLQRPGPGGQCYRADKCPVERAYWGLYLSLGILMFVFAAAWTVVVVRVIARLRALPYHRFKCARCERVAVLLLLERTLMWPCSFWLDGRFGLMWCCFACMQVSQYDDTIPGAYRDTAVALVTDVHHDVSPEHVHDLTGDWCPQTRIVVSCMMTFVLNTFLLDLTHPLNCISYLLGAFGRLPNQVSPGLLRV